ncbi:MAG: UDP-N-acetylmuramate dehydrogenase [Bacteroidetes bacterium]|nr:UDP-N-acetylmuramate dehydrogenase [Bacteroidota bacterium]
MISMSEIQKFFRGAIRVNEPMANHTWMKVGGPADWYAEPRDREDLVALIEYLQKQGAPFVVIGRGSNILVSDAGVRGAVINVEQALQTLTKKNGKVFAEAGVRLTHFVDFCIQHELAGVEMLAGIPGTVGGAVVMNAGAYGGTISDYIAEVEVIRNGTVALVSKEQAEFSYRHSGFTNDVVLSALFLLPKGKKEELAQRRRECVLKRNQTQPLEFPNLGSMFKNPPNAYAAQLIEQAGLKGKRIGGAQVSEKHANFIVNLGNATATDVMHLVDLVQRTVYQHFGVLLELEVKLVGFSPQQG